MPDRILPDLLIEGLPYGTHETPWDLRAVLYRGGAGTRRDLVEHKIAQDELGPILQERLPLVERIHGVLAAQVAAGLKKSTIETSSNLMFTFFAWADGTDAALTVEGVVTAYRDWTEVILDRVRVKKNLTHRIGYSYASKVASLLARSLGLSDSKDSGRHLLSQTRMRVPKHKKEILGAQADKQNLQETFSFGHMLTDLCGGLDVAVIRGALPVTISLRDGRSVLLKCRLKHANVAPENLVSSYRTRDGSVRIHPEIEQIRAPLPDSESALNKRVPLLNQRVEAELLIFIAQTGMNLAQAAILRREDYRWKTEGDDALAFRVHKGRRGGEAIFRCFKAYRGHLKQYLDWLEAVGLSVEDDRLFPLLHTHIGRFPAVGEMPRFSATRSACDLLAIRFVGPQLLRKTRVNWLLRRSRDPDQTAEMSAHSKETLHRNYEQPNHQVATAEVVRFHAATDPSLQPPGPGVCVNANRKPEPVPDCPPEAPQPDCISAEGCLFCLHHRDVMNAEYCWKLASHRHLKALEVVLWRAPKPEPAHPANLVIDRVTAKLSAIAEGSEVRALWVQDAESSMRAGRYHPSWQAHIDVLEVMT